jgi:DNA repair protein RecN (Recombination protein N)
MIYRFYLQDCLSFKSVDLTFENGLIVFSGASGSGKSVFMNAFLSLFGLSKLQATISEAIIKDIDIANEEFNISDDEIVIKQIKKDKIRYFLNHQSIAKKKLTDLISPFIKYLHIKDTSDFKSENMIFFLDKLILSNDSSYDQILEEFKAKYKLYLQYTKELKQLIEDEIKVEDIKEFISFEIDKIRSIDPKIGEYEELIKIKKEISKKEKLQKKLQELSAIFQYRDSVISLLEDMQINSIFFDDAMAELENIFESWTDRFEELDGINIEESLDRIEKLSKLIRRYGSIEDSLEYLSAKIEELNRYENISFEKKSLQKKIKEIEKELEILSDSLSSNRAKYLIKLENKVNQYLAMLYLEDVVFSIESKNIDITGKDKISVKLKNIDLDNISSGEFNRLRLALLTAYSSFDFVDGGILFLDEIDANLSGKESESIAKVLATLSQNYQIFAISHQPQLTAIANQHFLIKKQDDISTITLLDDKGRIEEIARIISGETISTEAIEYAKSTIKAFK